MCGNKTALDKPKFIQNYVVALASMATMLTKRGSGDHVEGSGNSVVYAFGQCMKDLTADDCHFCVDLAVHRIYDCKILVNGTSAGKV